MAKEHLARFVVSLVLEQLDLVDITGTYGSEKRPGAAPSGDDDGVAALHCSGIYSSRRIAKACRDRLDS